MGIIKKLRGRSAHDRFLGDDQVRGAYESMQKGSWTQAAELLASRSDGWFVAGFLAGEGSEIATEHFESWTAQDPSSESFAMLGLARIRDAWLVRGVTQQVSTEAWPAFSGGLESAESDLSQAMELDPGAAAPWAAMLRSGRGLKADNAELRRRFDGSHEREPFRQDACVQYLQCLCVKWGGDEQEMFDFARWIEHEAPADSAARLTLPMAHYESAVMTQWNEEAAFGSYLAREHVVDELTTAAEGFLDATSDDPPTSHLSVLNTYALVVLPVSMAASEVLRECVTRIRSRATDFPWATWGDDPLTRYQRTAQAQLAEASLYLDG